MASLKLTGETHLILERSGHKLIVKGARARRPRRLEEHQILIKFKVTVPANSFDLIPLVTVDIPEGSVIHPVIQVEETGLCECGVEHERHVRTCPECEGAVR